MSVASAAAANSLYSRRWSDKVTKNVIYMPDIVGVCHLLCEFNMQPRFSFEVWRHHIVECQQELLFVLDLT